MTTSTNGSDEIQPRYEPEPDDEEDVVAGERGAPRSGAPLARPSPAPWDHNVCICGVGTPAITCPVHGVRSERQRMYASAIDGPATVHVVSARPADVDAKALSGMGRDAIEQLVLRHQEDRRRIRDERNVALKEARTLNDNLTAVQARCTELLNTDRIAAFLEDKPASMVALLDLAWAIERARLLHPEGASVLALMQESGEVGRALEREDAGRYRSELLDTAVVAMRLYIAGPNDVDERLQPREPHAAKKLARTTEHKEGAQ